MWILTIVLDKGVRHTYAVGATIEVAALITDALANMRVQRIKLRWEP